eukprot:526415-Amphidinium_carterae.1
MTLTCHERQPWLVYSCAIVHLRFHGHRDADDEVMKWLGREAVEILCCEGGGGGGGGEWHGLTALKLAEMYPAIVAREFHSRVCDVLRWLKSGGTSSPG